MTRRVLLDAGPLVALLSSSDSFHVRCVEVLKSIEPPLYTSWPVLTEAAWLLRSKPALVERLLASGNTGLFKILPLTEEDGLAISAILKRYRNLKPQLADASLVYLAQREGIDTVFTLDLRDFHVYRYSAKRSFIVLP
jgi:predicted nucleic acid-binding protein